MTHILAGLLAAEAATRFRARRATPGADWIRAAYFTSALANNVPDLDFLYVGLSGAKLGYLLHHRGHTHTLAGVPLGLVAAGVVAVWARRRRLAFCRDDWSWLVALALAGPVLHVFMDFSNVYGVHPFWPFDERWVYGDRIFIVEPLFWAAGLPPVFWAVRARVGRTLCALWLALTVVLPFVTRVVPLALATLVLLWTVGGLVVLARASPERRVLAGLGGSLLVLLLFSLARPAAEGRVRSALKSAFPADAVHDVVLSPGPANPLCWVFVGVQTGPDGRYALRRGRVSLLPWGRPAERCDFEPRAATAPLRPVTAASTAAVSFDGEFVAPLAELGRLARENCEVSAFLRFARAPFWVEQPGTGLVVGDLRFDRERGLRFAELIVEREPRACPRFVPPWRPPRADLLEPRPD